MDNVSHLQPIPRPPGRLFVGNLFDLDVSRPIESLVDLARTHGPIFQMSLPGRGPIVIVSGYELVNELCDESRFDKKVGPGLSALADGPVGRGLFTSETTDPNWRKAHNVLMPAFSMDAMRGYYPRMLDIAVQLTQKWERLNPDDTVDVPADMTRLTLDTIALCGFNYRFNSLYRESPHPFVVAMLGVLETAQTTQRELPIQRKLHRKRARQLLADQQFMLHTVQRLIQDRRASSAVGTINDLLDRMLTVVDRQSGEKLDDANIIAQCVTFLIAGHETTSGLLSFALNALLKNPGVLTRAYDEVDRVLGTDLTVLPTYAQIHQLPYVDQILKETLRLWPTAPAFTRRPYEDTVIGGKYRLEKAGLTTVLTPMLHRDKQVWGEHPEDFDPDRFNPERGAKIPPNAFLPFGTGQRACIGRQFAMQEAILVLGMLLQRFELIDFANYKLETKQTLTVKPDNFHIKVKLRAGGETKPLVVMAQPAAVSQPAAAPPPSADAHQTRLLVLYGSNLGTAEGLAHGIADEARNRGFVATVEALDDHVGALPKEGGVIIVAASYNGQPPDNAAKFCRWLQDPSLAADAFAGVEYSVYGCGNRDWAATYQAIPTLIDAELEKHGAKRMYRRGEGDARSDFDGDYRTWNGGLWPSMAAALHLPDSVARTQAARPRLSVAFVNKQAANPIIRSYSATGMTVRVNRELQHRDCERPSERSTRHLEIALPSGVSYNAGDHLGIVPRNGLDQVRRVLLRFKLDPGLYLTITPHTNASTYLPVNEPVPLLGVLAHRVELQDVVTRAQLATLAEHTGGAGDREMLLALAGDDTGEIRYREQVLVGRKSVLDVLDEVPSCQPPFEVFLDLLPPLRPRYYSISSSPLVSSDSCSITVGVVEGPARSGHGAFKGICSNYLATQPVDATVFGFIRKPTIPFCPPDNPHVPMIMIGPGTGVAPFRGFLQERAALKEQGVPVGESILFFGCRDPLQDFLYEDELRGFEAMGVTRLFSAFSREPGKPKAYVQQAIKERSEDVWRLLQQEGVVFVCGDASRMAPDVRKALMGVFQQRTGTTAADAQAWLTGLTSSHRYLEDIWASAP
ncbi:cytochrome P450 (plasmid) [Bradyrhizobium sp. CB82]|uniref:bifunctional cytochrome P450/NADPH--P450 reductase n=1 Tax=Bradyrhizobium sp. CB82 TaxID=3039159 RepID=UPI0024B1A7EE|nr:cytochrome P450 [Bradyrhizobium sp. CB82]WFU45452.1 cytochrome P450 [Bradyrhizobium sp. CB82]